ncbi:MAG: THUMP domain-containing protein [archaeon]|nr:THUMP domain-containing protein [archaeon]
MAVILARYCEIGLKNTPARKRFEGILKKNILDMLAADGIEALVTSVDARYYVRSSDIDGCVSSVKRVFGITSLSVTEECSSKMEDICASVAEYSVGRISSNQSFAIRARRNGDHPYTSMDIGREAGSAVFLKNKDKGARVDLTNPNKIFYIEIRNNRAYIFDEYVNCPGGLPLGCQGHIIAEVNDKRGFVSAWMMMKRGCKVLISGNYRTDILKKYDPSLCVLEGWGADTGLTEKILGRSVGCTMDELDSVVKCEVPLYFPTIGMSDAEVDSLFDNITRFDFRRY